MKKALIVIIILAQAILYNACNSKENKKAEKEAVLVNESDVDEDAGIFMKNASKNGIMEIEFGKVATLQASSPDVKQFAEKMVADHTRIYNELKRLATDKYILLPIKLEPDQLEQLNNLRKLEGAAFDESYIRTIISAHEEAINDFERASKNRDKEVNKFASSKLDSIKTHLNTARSIFNNLVINRQ